VQSPEIWRLKNIKISARFPKTSRLNNEYIPRLQQDIVSRKTAQQTTITPAHAQLIWVCLVATAKESEEVNRKCLLWNMTVQLLTVHSDFERHNIQRYRRTDGHTDDIMMPISDHNVMVNKKSGDVIYLVRRLTCAIEARGLRQNVSHHVGDGDRR